MECLGRRGACLGRGADGKGEGLGEVGGEHGLQGGLLAVLQVARCAHCGRRQHLDHPHRRVVLRAPAPTTLHNLQTPIPNTSSSDPNL